jgi:hypothetical protein
MTKMLTQAKFEKLLGEVSFDEDTMVNHDKICVEPLDIITSWNTDASIFEKFVQDNVRQALLVFMSGLCILLNKDSVDIVNNDGDTIMQFSWKDVVGYENAEDASQYESWTASALESHTKAVHERMKSFSEEEE